MLRRERRGFLAVRNFDFFAGDSCRRRLVLLSLDSSDQRRQLLEFKVVTMSSESEGDEPGSNSGNGSHFEPHSHHVTPITPLTQVAPGMMMGQTNVSMQSVGMPQSTVQTAVPQMFPVFPGNPGALPQGMKAGWPYLVLNALWHYHNPAITRSMLAGI